MQGLELFPALFPASYFQGLVPYSYELGPFLSYLTVQSIRIVARASTYSIQTLPILYGLVRFSVLYSDPVQTGSDRVSIALGTVLYGMRFPR